MNDGPAKLPEDTGPPPDPPVGSGGVATEVVQTTTTLLALQLGRSEFALPITILREVLRTPPITPVPFTPPYVAGLASVRGAVLPVVDLGIRLLDQPVTRPGHLVVIGAARSDTPVAVLVDGLNGAVEATDEQIRHVPPEIENRFPPGVVSGLVVLGQRLISVLDVDPLLFPEHRTE